LSALASHALVRDPKKPEGEPRGSLVDLLAMPALWPILIAMFVCYAPAAGLRGLWISPYVAEVHGATLTQIGIATLAMSLAHRRRQLRLRPDRPLARHAQGPDPRGQPAVALLLLSLWLIPPSGLTGAIVIFALIGFFGASYPIVISHGRSFLPAHLTGRGVTLLNLFGMGGAGVMQFASGPVYARLADGRGPLRPSDRSSRSSPGRHPRGMAAYALRARQDGLTAQHLPQGAPPATRTPLPPPRPSCKRRAS
jgi:hypothetical protein